MTLIGMISAVGALFSIVSFTVYTRQSKSAGCSTSTFVPVPILFPFGEFLTRFWFNPQATDCGVPTTHDPPGGGGGLPGGGGGPPPIVTTHGAGVNLPPTNSNNTTQIFAMYPSNATGSGDPNSNIRMIYGGVGRTVPVQSVFGVAYDDESAMAASAYMAQRITGVPTADTISSSAVSLNTWNPAYFIATAVTGYDDSTASIYGPWNMEAQPGYAYADISTRGSSTYTQSDESLYDQIFLQSTSSITANNGTQVAFQPPTLQNYYEGGKWFGGTTPGQTPATGYSIGSASSFYQNTNPQFNYNLPWTSPHTFIPQTTYYTQNPPSTSSPTLSGYGRQRTYGNPYGPYLSDRVTNGTGSDAADTDPSILNSQGFARIGWATSDQYPYGAGDTSYVNQPATAVYTEAMLSGSAVQLYDLYNEGDSLTYTGADPNYVWETAPA